MPRKKRILRDPAQKEQGLLESGPGVIHVAVVLKKNVAMFLCSDKLSGG